MSKHTPAPWAVVERQRKLWVLTNPDSNPFTGQVIAQQTTCPDWIANAHLIAAAPELLQSLHELLTICRYKCSPSDEVLLPNGKSNHRAIVDATAAVEKAEGNDR